ncbi:hypothetical protein ACFQ5N_09630 [Lutibacter holmesii]|uniref:Sugar transporter n=1 Tax=Lutibacter holmesii TaxID=1137985 RepID=A0ABW3WPK5_9FLAO
MTTTSTTKPTKAFWIIGSIALLWNLMGVIAYYSQINMTNEALSLLSEPEQLYYKNVESWATAAYATAVFGGFLGCVTLLLKRKITFTLFILSLIGVLVQATYNLFIQEFMEVTAFQMGWTTLIIVISIFLVWYSKIAINKGWLYK